MGNLLHLMDSNGSGSKLILKLIILSYFMYGCFLAVFSLQRELKRGSMFQRQGHLSTSCSVSSLPYEHKLALHFYEFYQEFGFVLMVFHLEENYKHTVRK